MRWREIEDVLDVTAEQLPRRDGGGEGAARAVRGVAVEEFAQVTEPRAADEIQAAAQQRAGGGAAGRAAAVDAHVSRHQRPEQPRVNAALMQGRFARGLVARVMVPVAGAVFRESAQS